MIARTATCLLIVGSINLSCTRNDKQSEQERLRTDYVRLRADHEGLRQQNEELQAASQELRNSLTRERVARALALSQLQTKYERVKIEYARMASEKRELEANFDVAARELESASRRIDQIVEENMVLRDELKKIKAPKD